MKLAAGVGPLAGVGGRGERSNASSGCGDVKAWPSGLPASPAPPAAPLFWNLTQHHRALVSLPPHPATDLCGIGLGAEAGPHLPAALQLCPELPAGIARGREKAGEEPGGKEQGKTSRGLCPVASCAPQDRGRGGGFRDAPCNCRRQSRG